MNNNLAMKVLMFGWEFPPHISGGLGTACYGLTKSLSAHEGLDITFVVPKVYGDEAQTSIHLLGANQVDLIKNSLRLERSSLPITRYSVKSLLVPYVDPEVYPYQTAFSVEGNSIQVASGNARQSNFTGQYGPSLMTEIRNFATVGEYIAGQNGFDLIHAHDWLTFPAGIAAKKRTGKPLIVHVHATDFDRSGGKVNPQVFQIEKQGMEYADCIICVSNRTRDQIIGKYAILPSKTCTVHNGVEKAPLEHLLVPKANFSNKVVTFLGRITLQKGPEYFVRVAELVLSKMKNVWFVMAGSGDQFPEMVRKVARAGIASRFLFTGFLKGEDVYRLLKCTDVFVMPSVSEPFGICPLEAMQMGVPVIISKQSGVAEVIKHSIKIDFWDVHAMADAIHGILSHPSLFSMMAKNGQKEAQRICWEDAAEKIHALYRQLLQAG